MAGVAADRSSGDSLLVSVMGGLPDAVIVLDRNLRVLLAGGGGLALTGWDAEALKGKRLAGAFPDAQKTLVAACRAAVGGRASTFEYRESEASPQFRCYAAPRQEAGVVKGAVLTLQEVTAEREAALSVAGERKLFREAFSAASVGMAMTALDGTLLRVNARLIELTGRSEEELVGLRLKDLVDPGEQPPAEEGLSRLAARELDEYMHEGRYLRADGTTFPGSLRVARVADDSRRSLFFVAHLADVSDRDATEHALRTVTERFESAFENAPLGMALLTAGGKPFQVNRALTEITGYGADQLLAMPVQDIVHPEDLNDATAKHAEELLAGELGTHQGEMRWFDAEGHVVWVSLSVSTVQGPAGTPDHFVVQVTDISGRKRMQERMEYLADHDALTGLLARRRFEAELAQNVARARRYAERGALLLVDLDRFKEVNDSLGHSVGDKLLRHVAGLLRDRLRDSDVIGRLGGDEFAVLLPHVTPEQAREVADDVGEAIAVHVMTHDDVPVECSASIGVAPFGEDVESAEALLIAADLAMYRIKDSGK